MDAWQEAVNAQLEMLVLGHTETARQLEQLRSSIELGAQGSQQLVDTIRGLTTTGERAAGQQFALMATLVSLVRYVSDQASDPAAAQNVIMATAERISETLAAELGDTGRDGALSVMSGLVCAI